MITLIIDTSTERGIVACVKDNAILFSNQLPFGLLNSQFLLPELHKALKTAKIDVKQLSHIVVGIGPGSYTGMRVGVIVAKTLSFSLHIPLIGVCSLDGFLPDCDGEFATVIDAKIGGVYLQKGCLKEGIIYPLIERCILPLQEATDLLKDTTLIVTPNATSLVTKFAAQLPQGNWIWQECYPNPLQLATIGMEKYRQGEYTTSGHLDLLYMRKTQAEIEMDKKLGTDSDAT